jgi:hypothetical protein
MGRRKDEPLIRICEVEVVDVRRERLSAMTDDDVEREGFDINEWVASDFVEFFCEHMNCMPDTRSRVSSGGICLDADTLAAP